MFKSFELDLTALGTFSLSPNQERVLLSNAAMRQASFNVPPPLVRFGLRLTGGVDPRMVRDALTRVVERHPALRCSFSENIVVPAVERHERLETFRRTGIFQTGLFVQTVHRRVVLSLNEFDWAAMDHGDRQNAIHSLVRQEDLRPFGNSDTCRMRASLIRTGASEALLLLVFDHAAFDGFSARIVRREFERVLQNPADADSLTGGISAAGGFPEFAEWQRRMLATNYFRRSIAFWRDQWAGFAQYRIAREDLPFSVPLPERPELTFATERVALDATNAAGLRDFAASAGTTAFTICLAALASVLGTYTGRSKIAIWSHLLNRVQAPTQDAVGFFVNTHLLGIDLQSADTGRELIRHVAGVVASSLAHQELPLPCLWNALRCVPHVGDAQILLDFRALPPQSNEHGPVVRVDRWSLPDQTTPRLSSLGAYVLDAGDRIELAVTYWTACFAKRGVEHFLSDLRQRILALVHNPDGLCDNGTGTKGAPNSRMGHFLVLDSECIPMSG